MVPLDEPELRRWQQQAERTADAARLAAEGGRPEWACFLAEQAAQLAVKGLLHGLGREAWGHDLTVLVGRAASEFGGAWPPGQEDAAARLSRHYIAARYPDAHPSGPPGAHYRPSDAETARADSAALMEAVEAAWTAVTSEPG